MSANNKLRRGYRSILFNPMVSVAELRFPKCTQNVRVSPYDSQTRILRLSCQPSAHREINDFYVLLTKFTTDGSNLIGIFFQTDTRIFSSFQTLKCF